MGDRESVELFHLSFLAELGRKLDAKLYAIKGGCNLRFFLRSPRYSEDLDLDVQTVDVGTLRAKVSRLLDSRAIELSLVANGLRVVTHSAPKQTEVTQRFKIQLEELRTGARTNTKVEFSRRGISEPTAFDPIDPRIVSEHRVPAFFSPHYTATSAFVQKVRALAGRNETQARDVFDLDLLIRSGVDGRTAPSLSPGERDRARANAMGVGHDAFLGQVLAFLPEEDQGTFRKARDWEQLVLRVVDALEESPS